MNIDEYWEQMIKRAPQRAARFERCMSEMYCKHTDYLNMDEDMEADDYGAYDYEY